LPFFSADLPAVVSVSATRSAPLQYRSSKLYRHRFFAGRFIYTKLIFTIQILNLVKIQQTEITKLERKLIFFVSRFSKMTFVYNFEGSYPDTGIHSTIRNSIYC